MSICQIYDLCADTLWLGRYGENGARDIAIDVGRWFADLGTEGTVVLVNWRPGEDDTPYNPNVTMDGSKVVWSPSSIDLAISGRGFAELRYYVGNALAKSKTFRTVIDRTPSEGANPPSAAEDWLERMEDAAVTAQGAAQDAEDAAETATEGAQAVAAALPTVTQAAQTATSAATTATNAATEAAASEEVASAAANAAQSASETATAASQTAVGAATTATTKAAEAAQSATTATQKASEAAQSATAASASAGDAEQAATTATAKAQEASASASGAATSASQASSSATSAASSATTASNAQTVASQAASTATSAASTATAAKTGAETAQTAAEQAAASVTASAEQIETNKNDITAIKADLSQLVPISNRLAPYLYKENTYIRNGVETALSGYDLFKIPVSQGDVVFFSQTTTGTVWWNTLTPSYAFALLKDDETYVAITSTGSDGVGVWGSTSKVGLFQIPGGVTHLMAVAYHDYVDNVRVGINVPLTQLNADGTSVYNTVFDISEKTAFKSTGYKRNTTPPGFAVLSGGYFSHTLRVKSGDKLTFTGLVGALSFYGTFTDDDGACRQINSPYFTAPSDGMVSAFAHDDYPQTATLYPANSIKIDYTNVANAPDGSPYNGLLGIAFGTSLTYRAQTTYGYLQYLPALSGITFDNQGIGSSTILGNMLTAIKGYTEYADKRVAILEGFVNDWYTNKDLGTYEDTGETTVCGCVRSAINYMLSQNANLTVFLVLDPYGRNYGGVNCATTATNGAGLTQKEYYDEIAKVGESLGIPVIKEYAISQISENTPQYIVDNIHPTALGAKQSAYVIWSQMRQHFPNQV